jgi:ABC-2 type transport system permease protein
MLEQLKLLWHLIYTDLIIFKKEVIGGLINTIIWVSILLCIGAFVYPQLGMTLHYGTIYLIGTIISCALFETEFGAITLLVDLEGNNTTSYYLTLPTKPCIIFLKSVFMCAIKAVTFTIIILPIGKIILRSRFDFATFSLVKFILMFISIALFSGFLGLFMTTLAKDMLRMSTIWVRFLFPLWMFGGSSFPLNAVKKVSPLIANILLLNPITYAYEGLRASVLGQTGYLNVWFCFVILWVASFSLGFLAIRRLKQRLDFV